MYTYEVSAAPVMCDILSDGTVVDRSGPWESLEIATEWAEAFTAKCNSGYVPFSE
jgi:hypothetical protein